MLMMMMMMMMIHDCFQAAASESSSDSDSDVDDETYETICLQCQAGTQHSLGHVVSDVTRSTSVRTTAKSTSGLADKPETETKRSARNGGNGSEPIRDGVIIVWGAYNPELEEPQTEVDEEADHVTQSVSLMLPCVEEVIFVIIFVISLFLMHRRRTSISRS